MEEQNYGEMENKMLAFHSQEYRVPNFIELDKWLQCEEYTDENKVGNFSRHSVRSVLFTNNGYRIWLWLQKTQLQNK